MAFVVRRSYLTIELIREVIEAFYDRVVVDPMIGFMFAGKDIARLKNMQLGFTCHALGIAAYPYSGKPLKVVHRPLKIRAGQFQRRQRILQETLEGLQVDPELSRRWLDYEARLEPLIRG